MLAYAEREPGKPPARLTLGDFDAELIRGFLTHVEAERHNTVRTRNARLAAIRAFAPYLAAQRPPALLLVQQILAIPMKRFDNTCGSPQFDLSVIALWLGHESPITTHGYIEADLYMKERALAAITPPKTRGTRYRPTDALLRFLQAL